MWRSLQTLSFFWGGVVLFFFHDIIIYNYCILTPVITGDFQLRASDNKSSKYSILIRVNFNITIFRIVSSLPWISNLAIFFFFCKSLWDCFNLAGNDGYYIYFHISLFFSFLFRNVFVFSILSVFRLSALVYCKLNVSWHVSSRFR